MTHRSSGIHEFGCSLNSHNLPPFSALNSQAKSTGYQHSDYAAAFREFATPKQLRGCDGWILVRSTPILPYRDAIGCYPLFACKNWSGLRNDLSALRDELVCLSLVADPFGPISHTDLTAAFDNVIHYKNHLVTDLRTLPARPTDGTTRRNLSKALKHCELEVCEHPIEYLEDWLTLYHGLVQRHGISGIRAFSRKSFETMLRVPGLVMLRASNQGQTIGLHTWMISGDRAYGHLGATNDLGYRYMAAYALYWYAIEVMKRHVEWLDLGAAPDTPDGTSGLTRFKQRWATGTRPTYLCSRIFDQEKYRELTASSLARCSTDFFPAYRVGGFA